MPDAQSVDPIDSTTAGSTTTPVGTKATATSPTGAVGDTSAVVSVNSMEELQKKAPEVYKQIMLGIAQNICDEMRRHQDHMKEAMRDSRKY